LNPREDIIMKKFYAVAVLSMGVAVLSGCGPQADVTLKVYNWGGYIYERDPSVSGDKDLTVQFEDWYREEYGVTVDVQYATYGTNEEMYTNIALLNRDYHIFAPSDYMIQKMMREGWLAKFDTESDGSKTYLSNYESYVSPYLQSIYEELSVPGYGTVSEYAAGYMWGTVGLVYNPEKVDVEDMSSWQALYDVKYKNKGMIKDSVREVLMAAIMDVYKDEFNAKHLAYNAGEITGEEYNNFITTKINTIDNSVLQLLEESLTRMVANSYGLETDNAKNDIVSNRIDMFMAWSGDATYAMDTADEEDGVALEYVIPDEGSNIWFDGFVMHKDIAKNDSDVEEDKQVKVVAQRFIDYVSQPEIAIMNMGYIGYTSFIAGDEVLQSVIDLNDEYNEDILESDLVELDMSYFFNGTLDELDSEDSVVMVQPRRQIMTQYPLPETIIRTAIFSDFGVYDSVIAEMWQRVKSA
jgi:spermidine/putrescine transport system substrate-binding protein